MSLPVLGNCFGLFKDDLERIVMALPQDYDAGASWTFSTAMADRVIRFVVDGKLLGYPYVVRTEGDQRPQLTFGIPGRFLIYADFPIDRRWDQNTKQFSTSGRLP